MSKKVRVLQLMDKTSIHGAPIHGVSQLMLWLWPHFAETDYALSLCVLRAADSNARRFSEVGMPVQYLSRGEFDMRTLFDLIKIIKRQKIQILHCHGYGATTFGRFAGFVSRIPVIVHEHMVDRAIPSYQKWIDKLQAAMTAHGIAVSEAVRDFMAGPRALSRQRLAVIYNGIPQRYFEPVSQQEQQALAQDLDLRAGVPVFGCIGRLTPIKAHHELFQAAQKLAQENIDFYLLVIGEGELKQSLRHQVAQLNLQDRVRFLGHRDDVYKLVGLVDAIVISSYSEGCPLSVLEAMAGGKAIVSTQVGGIPEMLTHEVDALLVPARNPQAIAKAMLRLVQDKALMHRLQVQAKKTGQERFHISQTVAEICQIYRTVLLSR